MPIPPSYLSEGPLQGGATEGPLMMDRDSFAAAVECKGISVEKPVVLSGGVQGHQCQEAGGDTDENRYPTVT